MGDIVVGCAERIVKVGFKIQEAVETVKQNKEDCQGIAEAVTTLMATLPLLQEIMKATNQPGMNGALMGLEKSLDRALKLVTDCQERHKIMRFRQRLRGLFTAREKAKQLAQVKGDLGLNVIICGFVVNVQRTWYTVTVPCSDAHHLAPAQLQDAGKVDISYNSPTAGHSGSGASSEIIMSATGSEVPCAALSGTTEFTQLEATTKHFIGEKINEGGGRSKVYMMQKIVIKVQMPRDMYRSKAMALVAATCGVDSVAIAGDGKDQVVVVGEGVDSIRLTAALRRKVGPAQLVQVEVDEQKKEKKPAATTLSAPTPVSAASPSARLLPRYQPACTQDHPSASPRRDLSKATDPLPPAHEGGPGATQPTHLQHVQGPPERPVCNEAPATDDEASRVQGNLLRVGRRVALQMVWAKISLIVWILLWVHLGWVLIGQYLK